MCARFHMHKPRELLELLEAVLGAVHVLDPPERHFNIAPRQRASCARMGAGASPELLRLQWGLVPRWARDDGFGVKCINARAETVAEKPAFRDAFRHHRCLVLATGFFEWVRRGKQRQPFSIGRADETPFAFAGLWAAWPGPKGEPRERPLETFTVVTCPANALVSRVHERMPVILPVDVWATWLSPATPAHRAEQLLLPFPASEMAAHPVHTDVGNVRNERPDLIDPVPLPDWLTGLALNPLQPRGAGHR